MNLVDCYVEEIIGNPFFEKHSGCWGIKVKYNSYGIICEGQIFLDTKEEILKIKIGYKFLN